MTTEAIAAAPEARKEMEDFTAKFLGSSDEDFAKIKTGVAPVVAPATSGEPPVVPAPVVVTATPPTEAVPAFPVDLEVGGAPAPVVAAPVVSTPSAEEAAEVAAIEKFDPRVKAAIMKERVRNKELRDKVAQFEAAAQSTAPAAEVETLRTALEAEKKQRTELEEQIGRLDLSQSPVFKNEFDNKIIGIKQRAAKKLMDDGVAQADAMRVVEQASRIVKPSEREAFLQDNAAGVSGTISNMLSQADDIAENRQVALQNWRATKLAQQESSTQNSTLVARARIKQDVTKAIDTLRQEKNGFYMESPTDQKWNAAVTQRVSMLEGVLQRQNPEQIVRLVADGLTSPMYRQLYATLHAENQQLKAELESRDRRNVPFAGGGYTPGAPARQTAPVQGDTIDSLARKFLGPQ